MTFCRKTIWLLVTLTVLLPTGCASQRGRMASEHNVNTAQLLAAARQYEKEGNLQSAAGIYQHVLQYHPGNQEAREGLALVQQGKLRVNFDAQQLLASTNPAIQQNPQAREQLARLQQSQRDQINDRMAELIAQAAQNPTEIDVDPTPTEVMIASTRSQAAPANPATANPATVNPVTVNAATATNPAAPTNPAPANPAPTKIKTPPQQVAGTEPRSPSVEPESPAPIAQVAAVGQSGTSAVETTDFTREEQDERTADWGDEGWKGHSLTDKCHDASADVLTQVRRLESPADADRKQGLTRLARMGPEAISAAPAVRRLLNDPNQMVCAHAAWAIWEIEGDAQTALDVLQQSLTSRSTHVVQFACYTLGNLGDFAKPAVPTLTMLLTAEDRYVQLHAAEALVSLCEGDDAASAMDTLLLLLKDADAGVRMLAATTLGGVKPADADLAIAALTAALDDDNAGVRSAAALSLGGFGASAEAAVTRLEQAISSDQTPVRNAATTALACIHR